MEKVAASKMKKTQDRMERGRPYRNRMLEVIGHLANGQPEYKPTYMVERQPKNIVIHNGVCQKDFYICNKSRKKIRKFYNFSSIKSNLIRPKKIIDKKDNIIIFTDYNKNLNNKLFNIKKISINIKDPDSENNIIYLNNLKIKENNLSKLFLKFNTDKGKYFKSYGFKDRAHNYSRFYVRNLSHLKNKKINILEIGTYRGDAAAAFISYFKKSNLVTIDNTRKLRFKSKRIKFYKLDY